MVKICGSHGFNSLVYHFISYYVVYETKSYLLLFSETNQELIMDQGGIGLLSSTAANAEDPQTLRMVAGAIANLCGNGIFDSSLFFFHFIMKKNSQAKLYVGYILKYIGFSASYR